MLDMRILVQLQTSQKDTPPKAAIYDKERYLSKEVTLFMLSTCIQAGKEYELNNIDSVGSVKQ